MKPISAESAVNPNHTWFCC